ncbi:MAG: hypothetical protein E7474_04555 [Ruminococcaceae bacterium]|nr:hypothetical protein [Oscillospiraceae bacterium]
MTDKETLKIGMAAMERAIQSNRLFEEDFDAISDAAIALSDVVYDGMVSYKQSGLDVPYLAMEETMFDMDLDQYTRIFENTLFENDSIHDTYYLLGNLYLNEHYGIVSDRINRKIEIVTQGVHICSVLKLRGKPEYVKKALGFKKEICGHIVDCCDFYQFWVDRSEMDIHYYGLSAAQKQPLINVYISMLRDIRQIEPDYMRSAQCFQIPDPYDLPSEEMPEIERRNIAKEEWFRSIELT